MCALEELMFSREQCQYWEALGRFVDTFSMVENNMQLTLWHFSKVKWPIAQAVFSGVRIDAGSNYVRRIAEATDWPKEQIDMFEILLAQLGEITRVRNDILHYGGFLQSDGHHEVTNVLYAHTQERIRTTKITAEILDAMSSDLATICVQFMILRGARMTEKVLAGGQMPPQTAWHYKPERQQGRKQKPPKPRQARPRRPRPSHA
jgi:hypothetical protein